ncbi:MAG: response regulator [Desulfobacterales bacterium]|nr:response regulator [Desulfobacterales bacterium]MCP4163024.1 response regulator [Deltaproteobacteria bacterium]
MQQVLIVDDSTMMRKVARDFIGITNVMITEAESAEEGLVYIEKKDFDLIITDIDMPGLDGLEFCKKIKANSKRQSIPIIVLTSFETEKEIDRSFQAGASAYVSKSEIKRDLGKTVNDILNKSEFNRGHTVLVVEDSKMISGIVERGLSQAGFQVVTAENGQEALNEMVRKTPDLILSDIEMPLMDGLEFCKTVQRDSKYKNIPFVVMSTNNSRGIMKRMLSEGAETFVTKPFNIDQLVMLIDKLLSDQYLHLLYRKKKLDDERKITLSSIASLVAALEARDPYTKGHSEQVASIVAGMAELHGESQKTIEMIKVGAKLHDVGKIGIKDSILLKEGSLSDKEYTHIKQHVIIGASILEPIDSLSDIIPIIRDHHEQYDGKGYPRGLKGEDINIWARMTSVADTFHAMTSKRPYNKGASIEDAVEIINNQRGTQFCSYCVDLFLKYLKGEMPDSNFDFVKKVS